MAKIMKHQSCTQANRNPRQRLLTLIPCNNLFCFSTFPSFVTTYSGYSAAKTVDVGRGRAHIHSLRSADTPTIIVRRPMVITPTLMHPKGVIKCSRQAENLGWKTFESVVCSYGVYRYFEKKALKVGLRLPMR